MKISYHPFDHSANEYVERMKAILARDSDELFPTPTALGEFIQQRKKLKESIVIVNWIEDSPSYKRNVFKALRKCFKHAVWIIALRLFFKRIIWVRHNWAPHSNKRVFFYHVLVTLLDRLCYRKVAHRTLPGYEYIPHPLYLTDQQLSTVKPTERSVDYLIIGQIQRYKGILELLATWPPSERLLIRGKCKDKELETEIYETIRSRKLNCDFVSGFITTEDLNHLLLATKYVVLPHHSRSMIVSGAFFHAASFGANVLMLESDFSSFVHEKYCFAGLIDDTKGTHLHYTQPLVVRQQISAENSQRVIADRWKDVIGD